MLYFTISSWQFVCFLWPMAVCVFLILRRDSPWVCCPLCKNCKEPSSGPAALTVPMPYPPLGLLACSYLQQQCRREHLPPPAFTQHPAALALYCCPKANVWFRSLVARTAPSSTQGWRRTRTSQCHSPGVAAAAQMGSRGDANTFAAFYCAFTTFRCRA